MICSGVYEAAADVPDWAGADDVPDPAGAADEPDPAGAADEPDPAGVEASDPAGTAAPESDA